MNPQNKTHELSIANGAITMPGITFTRTGIRFGLKPTVEELNTLAANVMELQGGVYWWLGDIGRELQLEKGESYTAERAEIIGIDAGYWRNCVCLARFFSPSDRSDGLGFGHHWSAMRAAGGAGGDIKIAKTWLNRAKDNAWSQAAMRKQVNLALARSHPPTAPTETNPFDLIDAADGYLMTKPAFPPLTPDQARTQLIRWQALIAFVRHLEAIAAAGDPTPHR